MAVIGGVPPSNLQTISGDEHDLVALAEESLAEGHRMVARLRESWANGENRFDRVGEILLGAFEKDQLIAVCGLNVDPYASNQQIGRVRHLYVRASARRCGVGARLVQTIISRASDHFDRLNLRAPESAFRFYESLGFTRCFGEEFHTHSISLRSQAGAA